MFGWIDGHLPKKLQGNVGTGLSIGESIMVIDKVIATIGCHCV